MDSITKYGLPCLFCGSTGTGIKLYFKDGNVLPYDPSLNSTVDPSSVPQTDTQQQTSQVTQPSVQEPEDKSYGGALKKLNLTLISNTTTDEVLKNTLIQRMYPHYSNNVNYQANRLFTGNQLISLPGKKYSTNSGKTLFVLDQPSTTATDKLKSDCIKELAKEKTDNNQFLKLKEWCTEPTVKAVLERHKFKLLDTNESSNTDDDKWKEIIAGGWFSDTYKSQQTFITDLSKFTSINGKDSVTSDQIKELKTKCKTIANSAYVKNYFPATKDFINNLKAENKSRFAGIDIFQQAVQFCTDPKTSENYVQTGMHGQAASSIPGKNQNDYCYIEGKDIVVYKTVKTYEPFEGKSFWCAVRLVYEPKTKPKKAT